MHKKSNFQIFILFLFDLLQYLPIQQFNMGNNPITFLTPQEELKLHQCQTWDTRALDDGKRFLGVINKNPISSVISLMKSFQPTEKEFLQAAILDQFTLKWKGDLLSASRSQNPQPFFRSLIDQIEVRQKKLESLNSSAGNLVMLLKIYINLCGISFIVKDNTVVANLQWLKDLIIKMRLDFFQWMETHQMALISGVNYTFTDSFTNQKTNDSSRNIIQVRTQTRQHIKNVLANWQNFLTSQTQKKLQPSLLINKVASRDVSNDSKWALWYPRMSD